MANFGLDDQLRVLTRHRGVARAKLQQDSFERLSRVGKNGAASATVQVGVIRQIYKWIALFARQDHAEASAGRQQSGHC